MARAIVIRAPFYHNTEGNDEYVNITPERKKVSYIFPERSL